MSTSSSRRSGGSRHAGSDPPYVVMVGQAGSGKSEIAKKLAHPDFVSRNSKGSSIQTSDLFWTFDGKMVLCDVPEDQPGSDVFKGNIPLALALTFEKVFLILISVKANNDAAFENIKMYFDGLSRLLGLGLGSRHQSIVEILGVMITDADMISARHLHHLKQLADEKFNLRCILASRENLPDNGLLQEIRGLCSTKQTISTSQLAFYDLIKLPTSTITNWQTNINWRLSQLVQEFKDISQKFKETSPKAEDGLKRKDSSIRNGDVLFEFQALMEDRLVIACNKLANSQRFKFHGQTAQFEDIYMDTMVNQIRHILFDLKVATKKYLVERDVDPRRCPYCNEIWTKDVMSGCDGHSTCGQTSNCSLVDYNKPRGFAKLGKYAFNWTSGILLITLSSEPLFRKDRNICHIGSGCGRSINWQQMPQVDLGEEILLNVVLPSASSAEYGRNMKKVEQPTLSCAKVEQGTRDTIKAVNSDSGEIGALVCDSKAGNSFIGLKENHAEAKSCLPAIEHGVHDVNPEPDAYFLSHDGSKITSSSREETSIKAEQTSCTLSHKGIESGLQNLKPDNKENYVVLIGDVGVGKSTVVEKLTGKEVDRGDSKLSVTRTSSAHWSYEGTVIVSDTPGSNSIEDQLQHNEEIAAAFNYRPISRVFVVVKADTRIANVMRVVEMYSERLLSLPDDNMGVLVTHMDTVSWTPRDLKQRLTDEYGIECVLFCGKETPKEILIDEIKGVCGRAISFRVDSKNFSEMFKINNKMVKILKDTSKEIDEFTRLREQFERLIGEDSTQSTSAFLSQFQSWLEWQIKEAEKRLARSSNFTFEGEDEAKERGYIANLSNQIRVIFNDISLLSEVNNRTNIGGGSGPEHYIFKWKNGLFSVTPGNERKMEGETESSVTSRRNTEMSRSKASMTSTVVKRESLPPIESYCNDHEKYRSRERATNYSGYSGLGEGHYLRITPNNSRNSEIRSFMFDVDDKSSNAGLNMRFATGRHFGNEDDAFRANAIEDYEPTGKMGQESMKIEKGHPPINGNLNRNQMPLFSFNIVVNQSNVGKDKRIYTLQLHENDLRVVSGQIQNDDFSKNGKYPKVQSSALSEDDWPPEPWQNVSVSFGPTQTSIGNLMFSSGHQEKTNEFGTTATDSNNPAERNRYLSKSNNNSDMFEQAPKGHKSPEETKSRSISWLQFPSFGFNTRKSHENVDAKLSLKKNAVSDMNLKAKQEGDHRKEVLADGNFSINVVNKNPYTCDPSMGIIITPTPITNTDSKNDADTFNRATSPGGLSYSGSTSSSRNRNSSATVKTRDSKRKTLGTKRLTMRTWTKTKRDCSGEKDFREF